MAMQLAIKKDYSTRYSNGRLEFGVRAESNNIQSMLNEFFSSSVLAGSNSLECDACGFRTPHTQGRFLSHTPKYLVLTVGRMSHDWRANRSVKNLADVYFGPTVTLPRPHEAASELKTSSDAMNGHPILTYGLYAV